MEGWMDRLLTWIRALSASSMAGGRVTAYVGWTGKSHGAGHMAPGYPREPAACGRGARDPAVGMHSPSLACHGPRAYYYGTVE